MTINLTFKTQMIMTVQNTLRAYLAFLLDCDVLLRRNIDVNIKDPSLNSEGGSIKLSFNVNESKELKKVVFDKLGITSNTVTIDVTEKFINAELPKITKYHKCKDPEYLGGDDYFKVFYSDNFFVTTQVWEMNPSEKTIINKAIEYNSLRMKFYSSIQRIVNII